MKEGVKGLSSLVVKLDNINNIDLSLALNKACIVVENAAKVECPVQTGNLRRSITHYVEDNEGVIGTNVEYAPYVEFGTGLYSSQGNGRQDVPWRYKTADGKWHSTSGQKPQPFLQPALLQNQDKVEQIIKQTLVEELKKC